MKPSAILRLYQEEGIPLADIRLVLPLFKTDLDHAEIDERDIPEEEVKKVLSRLLDGYPAAYLAGKIEILGIELFLSEDVLIPRTETEDFLRAEIFRKKDLSGKKVLDLCTGSGFIALSVKRRYPLAEVVGTDISEKALSLARRSMGHNKLDVNFHKSDYLEEVDGLFDLVLCNPPYIPKGKEIQAPFEPELALFSGPDGMDSYRKIFPRLEEHLSSLGEAYFELEATMADEVLLLSRKLLPNMEGRILLDMEGKKRYLHLVRKKV